jgi:hypothetical protein
MQNAKLSHFRVPLPPTFSRICHCIPRLFAKVNPHPMQSKMRISVSHASYIFYVRSAHAICHASRAFAEVDPRPGQIAKHAQFPYMVHLRSRLMNPAFAKVDPRPMRETVAFPVSHACMGTLYVLGSICHAYAWFPRILSFRESRSSCMAMQSKMRNCLIFRVPWILGYPLRSRLCHASRVELSRKTILVAIQNAKLSHFACPMILGYPLRSRLNLPCIPRRAFAKVDPRPNPKCETVSFSASHGS